MSRDPIATEICCFADDVVGGVVWLEHELAQERVLEVVFGVLGLVNTGELGDVGRELVQSHG